MADEKVLSVKITGSRPLLMHSPQGIGQSSTTKKVTVHDPEEEAAAVLYKNKEGVICVPSLAVLACLRKAATEHKAPGRGKKTLKDFVYSGLRIDPDLIPLTPQEYDVDIRPVVINRSRVMRGRPKFDTWSLDFKLTIQDTSVWEPSMVREVLEGAGKFVGLLDFRPLFGTFTVTEMKDAVTGKDIK